MKKAIEIRKATTPGVGWIVSILGEDYVQERTRDDARELAKKIRAGVSGLSADEIRKLYKLG